MSEVPGHSHEEERSKEGFWSRNWILVRFYGLFGLFMGLFYLGSLHGPTDAFFTTTYPAFIAERVAEGLTMIGVESNAYRTQVHMPGFAFTIIKGCTGIFAMLIYASAVLAYPAGAFRKFLGLLMGIPTLMGINIIRLTVLGIIGVHYRQYFEYFHEYLWQGIFIVLVIVLWMFWRWLLVNEDFEAAPPVQPAAV